jgi:hypothetical protein
VIILRLVKRNSEGMDNNKLTPLEQCVLPTDLMKNTFCGHIFHAKDKHHHGKHCLGLNIELTENIRRETMESNFKQLVKAIINRRNEYRAKASTNAYEMKQPGISEEEKAKLDYEMRVCNCAVELFNPLIEFAKHIALGTEYID